MRPKLQERRGEVACEGVQGDEKYPMKLSKKETLHKRTVLVKWQGDVVDIGPFEGTVADAT